MRASGEEVAVCPVKEANRALAAAIRDRYRSDIRELVISTVHGGVTLHGRAATFYGKQMALHEVLRVHGRVVSNHIVVG